jgi:choline dehydrogenase-like flavoprotein
VRGAKFVTEMFFLAGSREVRPLLRGGKFFSSWNEARQWISGASIGDFMLYASHPMGTCRMGADPKRSVVRPDGRTHDIEGLYITDSSLHPSALGVNPQMTIMAHSLALGRKIASS